MWRRARVFQDAEGKNRPFGRCVLDQEREKEVRGDPGSGEPGILGGQPVEAQDRFQSFEGQFDLPANAIEADEQLRREGDRVERGDQDHVSAARKVRGSTSC